MKFKSKQDWWLALIIWGAMLFAIGSGVYSLFEASATGSELITVLLLSIILPIFLLWLVLSTCYVIDEKNLIIKYGPFKKTVPLRSIKSVKKTMNPLSSPALSLKRLEIMYGDHSFVLISPKDRDEFMEILSKRCPYAKIDR